MKRKALLTGTIGSPPLMRGTVILFVYDRRVPRITPAHAGNSLLPKQHKRLIKDHPRSCGEQMSDVYGVLIEEGSPPLMRGTVALSGVQKSKIRITPAHAGNSTACNAFPLTFKDHPRSCGEQPSPRLLLLYLPGSPPLMRGTGSIPG